MAATHKGAISFGLVHIPIALHTATQDNDIRFNQLCKEDGSRVKYKKVCANCGKEVTNADIVKGFEYEDGKYVTMTDADFEKAKTAKDRTVQILHFAELSDIPPIYFDKTYHAVPETGGDKAYESCCAGPCTRKESGAGQNGNGPERKIVDTASHRKGDPDRDAVF